VQGEWIAKGVNGSKFLAKTRILALGGGWSSSADMYESKTGRWTALPCMTTSRVYSPASCVVGSRLIVAGGSSLFGKAKFLSTAEYLDLDVEVEEMKWIEIPSTMTKARAWSSGVVLDDGVTFLVTGGNTGRSTQSSCEMLSTTTMTWRNARSMLTARAHHCTVLYQGKAVVLGGHESVFNMINRCEQYNPMFNSWSSLPPLTQPISKHSACVLNNKIYVCGGFLDDRSNNSSNYHMEVYDGGRWSVIDSSLSHSRSRDACVVWEGRLVVLGASGEAAQVYDERKNRWRQSLIPRLSLGREQVISF
jgi:hypothetical protein